MDMHRTLCHVWLVNPKISVTTALKVHFCTCPVTRTRNKERALVTIERFLGCAESAVLILNNPMKKHYVMQPCGRLTDLFVVSCPDPALASVALLRLMSFC